LIESLNSVERRAAIETGQEVDRQDINLRGKVNDEAEVLKRAFTFEELDAMDRRIKAARDGKVIEAPAVTEKERETSSANIIESKPVLEAGENHETMAPGPGSADGRRPSWRD
jgi:hypothetical protein